MISVSLENLRSHIAAIAADGLLSDTTAMPLLGEIDNAIQSVANAANEQAPHKALQALRAFIHNARPEVQGNEPNLLVNVLDFDLRYAESRLKRE